MLARVEAAGISLKSLENQRIRRADVGDSLVQKFSTSRQSNPRLFDLAWNGHADARDFVTHIQRNRRVQICFVSRADVSDRIPILAECPRLTRMKK